MVVLELVQIDDLRVWYTRNETDMLFKRFEQTQPSGLPGAVQLLHREEIQSRPVARYGMNLAGLRGSLARYHAHMPSAPVKNGLSEHVLQSLPVAFLLTLRDGQLQVALDAHSDNAQGWYPDWAVRHWHEVQDTLMLDARLMLDLRQQHNANMRGAVRVWHRQGHRNCPPQVLPAPDAKGISTSSNVPSVSAGDHHQSARGHSIVQAMELLSQGRSDGWALCLDALRSTKGGICYALSLDVVSRNGNLQKRWKGKVDIEL